jgi:hypothetical protein
MIVHRHLRGSEKDTYVGFEKGVEESTGSSSGMVQEKTVLKGKMAFHVQNAIFLVWLIH